MTRRTLVSAALLLIISLATAFWLISRPAGLPPAGSMQEPMADMPGMGEKRGEGSGVPVAPADATGPRREEKGGRVEDAPGMVTIPPEQQQAIGLRTAVVELRDMTRTIRTVGRVDVDERTLTHITIKLDGYIEQLYAHSTGERVTKGQPLFDLYSPDLVATQQEYLLALKSAQSLGNSAIPEVAEGAKTLLEVTRRRLELWDIREDQIKALERTGLVQKTMPIYSPVTGTVIKKEALHGMHVKPGDELYHIADLSRVWVLADIYEYEQPYVKVGQSATVSSSSVPGAPLKGQIGFIYPTLDPTTRTVKVRLEFPNPGLRLKPEMYADVEIRVEMGMMVAVPEDAVLDTGLRRLVFVERGPGMFEPREVTLGPKASGYVAVTTGVSLGEKVAVGANFLLDAESKLRSAGGMQRMMGQVGMGDWQMRGAYEAKMESMEGMKGMSGMKSEPSQAVSDTRQVSGFSLTFTTVPDKPKVGSILLRLKLTDQAGYPVTNAQVVFTYTMPMPGMTDSKVTAPHTKDGVYEGKAMLGMGGTWEVTATVTMQGLQPITEKFQFTVTGGGM